MRYQTLKNEIRSMGMDEETFAFRCGIDPDYFISCLDAEADFEPVEYEAMAGILCCVNNPEAQDELFFS